ncbi:MAG: hypothetical protein JXA64_11190 [Candidatus Fermentibacteraceae bacterium]|nr:hypothetical protein [Candidatus Fermentibacteraceae bacterium]MBN2609669.1 hypothetical protein [Candidatus Fermentibacteraceae bacterium]
MPALPEYRTRMLLQRENVPLVPGIFVSPGQEYPSGLPEMPVFLKAQIPGATSRKSQGLVRRIDSPSELRENLDRLLSPGLRGQAEGVLITEGLELQGEFYAGCTLDFGARGRLPGGMLLFSASGGSGVEGRSDSLVRIPFSLLHPPDIDGIREELDQVAGVPDIAALASILEGMISTFIGYKLTVLEINPLGLLSDGSMVVVDCRAEFEKSAVPKDDMDIFFPPGISVSRDLTRLEEAVELINRDDPSGTGFFRQNREKPSEGSIRVATNLCGGGGKMLWEMTTGSRTDIYTMNESDTSGGLSAFKSYRILRVILAQEGAQALLLTGSGMAFQNQHHLAAAVWKALKESPTPLPSLLRFGGTDEDRARELFERVARSLPVPVRTYPPEVFPNAMVDHVSGMAGEKVPGNEVPAPPAGEPFMIVENPPGKIFFYGERWNSDEEPPSVRACPTGFLRWSEGTLSTDPDARCIGCLMCETAALLEGGGEIFVQLDMPGEVD